MKGVDTIIAAVLVIMISIIGIIIVLESSQPSVGKLQEISLMKESKGILTKIDNAVRDVAQEGEGSTRVLQLSVSGGSYTVDTDKDTINFYMDSKSQIVGEGVYKTEENINIFGGKESVYLSIPYSNVNVTEGISFGKGYHSIIIKNNGYDFVNEKQLISISLMPPILPPTAFVNQYNQYGAPRFVKGGTPFGNYIDLNVLGEGLTYNIPEGIVGGGIFSYTQSQTENITGANTTYADNVANIDGVNYNVTSTPGRLGGIFTNQYNQSSSANVTGNASTNNQATINTYLNKNSDGQTWNVTEKGSTITLFNLTLNQTDLNFESAGVLTNWNNAMAGTDWTEQSGANCDGGSGSCAYTLGDATRHRIYYTVDLSKYNRCYIRWRYRKNSLDNTGECLIFDVYNGSYYQKWKTCSNTAPNNAWTFAPANAEPAGYIYDNVTYQGGKWINLTSSGLSSITRLSFNETMSGANDYGWIDNINLTCEDDTNIYALSVEHNATGMSYSEELNSVNVSVNFTSTVNDVYNMTIFDFTNSNWNSTVCQNQPATADTYYTIWCNITENPTNYISNDNKIRIRLNSTTDYDQGTLREDNVQYYVGYTLSAAYANISVEHNSSEINEPLSSITNINVTSLLKTNASGGIPFEFYRYNFNTLEWEQCSQASIGTSYTQMECIIATNPSYYISDNKIRIRLNSSGDTNTHEMMEDYLVYKIATAPKYAIELWHNSSQLINGNINSINATLNFTTNVSDDYSLQIYNWLNSEWIDCNSGSVAADTPTKWWCNITSNPMNYNTSDRRVRIRINSTADDDVGLLKEDYVQYFVGYVA